MGLMGFEDWEMTRKAGLKYLYARLLKYGNKIKDLDNLGDGLYRVRISLNPNNYTIPTGSSDFITIILAPAGLLERLLVQTKILPQ